MRTEVNLSDHYRMDIIRVLVIFSEYFQNQLSFKHITRDNLLGYLDSFRKPENADPLHKWIGTYNTNRIHLARFFKWLYSPDIEPDKRPRPPIINNISGVRFFDNTRLPSAIPILILFLLEIIAKISGLLIDLLLWVYFLLTNMFPLMSSMVYLFIVFFSHVV